MSKIDSTQYIHRQKRDLCRQNVRVLSSVCVLIDVTHATKLRKANNGQKLIVSCVLSVK